MALLLLGLSPFVASDIALPLFLALPAYMIHQYEEHDDNRFARFLNGLIGEEARGLRSPDIWVINVIFGWFLLLGVFHLTMLIPAWGVLAGYLLAINGLVHLVWAALFRAYNPGLWSAGLIFIPLALWIFSVIPAEPLIHFLSAAVILLLHAMIMVIARWRI